MGVEIEHKFLVKSDEWRSLAPAVLYRQGYVPTVGLRSVRIRIAGDQGFITIKGPTNGISRSEFEYEIPVDDAAQLLDTFCEPPLIEKYRHKISLDGLLWEVDEFLGENQGLVIAEVELQDDDRATLFANLVRQNALPSWIGEDVSHDSRYYNSNLAKHPFTRW